MPKPDLVFVKHPLCHATVKSIWHGLSQANSSLGCLNERWAQYKWFCAKSTAVLLAEGGCHALRSW